MITSTSSTRQRRLLSAIGADGQARLEAARRAAQQQGQPVWLALQRAELLPLTALIAPDTRQARLCDPHEAHIDAVAVQALFGLTPAEADVALRLAAGWQPLQIAAQLGVQPNTVAAHLKRTLIKTGAGRQAALVALLHGSVARAERP